MFMGAQLVGMAGTYRSLLYDRWLSIYDETYTVFVFTSSDGLWFTVKMILNQVGVI
jgi:hypothetical protein